MRHFEVEPHQEGEPLYITSWEEDAPSYRCFKHPGCIALRIAFERPDILRLFADDPPPKDMIT